MKQLIKLVAGQPTIVEDPWQLIRNPNIESLTTTSEALQLIPLPLWLAEREKVSQGKWTNQLAPWLSVEDDFEASITTLLDAPLTAIDFPTFRDGRGYSLAYLLRSRYAYRGELRAIGDILRDQLRHLRRCGFDAFDVRADKAIEDALKGLKDFSVHYQASVAEPLPLFRVR